MAKRQKARARWWQQMLWIVTARVQTDQRGMQQQGTCPFSPVCTDSTGANHSFVVLAKSLEEANQVALAQVPNIAIVRIELAREVDDIVDGRS